MAGWKGYPACSFGSTPQVEERLAALVIAGRKRATVWDGRDENPTEAGKRWVVTVAGRPVAVIETTDVRQVRFCDIDAAFAATEGEGDGSLRFWQIVHEDFFVSTSGFAPDMVLWCETFQLVAVIDASLEACATEHVKAEEREAAAMLAARG